jgi:hypothetical protein
MLKYIAIEILARNSEDIVNKLVGRWNVAQIAYITASRVNLLAT